MPRENSGRNARHGRWHTNCFRLHMNNSTLRLLIGSAMVITGAVLIFTETTSSRERRSLVAHTRKQARILKRQASKIGDIAADRLADAIDTGKAAYQHVAERVAG
jgi:hypothetical protein